MKKNLLSLVILSLLIVNIILNAVMLFSVLGTNKKTAAIVTDIASILQLELGDKEGGAAAVSIADTEVYPISEMTVALARGEGDTEEHYCMLSVSLSINTKHEDYSTYSDIASKEDLIKGEIMSVVGNYTAAEGRVSQDKICEEILERIQNLYGSDFIYKVTVSEFMVM